MKLCQVMVQACCDRQSALTWLRELLPVCSPGAVELWRQAVIDQDPDDDGTHVCQFIVSNACQLAHLMRKFASCVPSISVRIVDEAGEAWAVCDEKIQGGVKSNDCNPQLEDALKTISDVAGAALKLLNR
jgi:hypothetical protein